IAGLFPIVPAGLATSFALYPAINRWAISDRPCGTYCLLSSRLPAINRWAISDRPCGTRNFVCLVPSDKSLGYFRSSLRDLLSSFFTTPSDKSLGYFRSSLRDSQLRLPCTQR